MKRSVDGGEELEGGLIRDYFLLVLLDNGTVFNHEEGWPKAGFPGFVVERVYCEAVLVPEQGKVNLVQGRAIANDKAPLPLEPIVKILKLLDVGTSLLFRYRRCPADRKSTRLNSSH